METQYSNTRKNIRSRCCSGSNSTCQREQERMRKQNNFNTELLSTDTKINFKYNYASTTRKNWTDIKEKRKDVATSVLGKKKYSEKYKHYISEYTKSIIKNRLEYFETHIITREDKLSWTKKISKSTK